MLKRLGGLLAAPRGGALDEAEQRKYVERHLRDALRVGGVYCERVQRGTVVVRVLSGLIGQEVRLRQFDLAQALAAEAGVRLQELVVTQS
ncbi:MAG TPA: hypothetical protein VJC05_03570 [Candidatus Andersenbacteria bacterium]|nr:hypothetical protein [Candidatus Andersenbacteria bacterium]